MMRRLAKNPVEVRNRLNPVPKRLILIPWLLTLIFLIACGGAATAPAPQSAQSPRLLLRLQAPLLMPPLLNGAPLGSTMSPTPSSLRLLHHLGSGCPVPGTVCRQPGRPCTAGGGVTPVCHPPTIGFPRVSMAEP